ncbi:ImmA/IrrE family metallo-endopeptidase [Photobacterium sp. TLY01]|uniref:ImmA/IrrE family metallo-endopeptidase n=1 Tax=Photobacterium sp. TLY01 TaxID=2907534 RepID=UPI001F23E88C|nr:ImmA/IrrE family metallo-endopeptidase [Photobacterium sp. TLY01]UIP28876.1 ImmA/IrrE family metallo-endopeptidase [Photobacterium sp. TLY01]
MGMPAVKQVLDKYWDRRVPVNIEAIASNLGIDVGYISPFDPGLDEMQSLSGYAEVTDDGRKFAYANLCDSPNRQRFTLAHEIGHHVLGHVYPGAGKRRDYPGSFSTDSVAWEEREANNFAAELLMPDDAIRHFIYNLKISSIVELASHFKVSQVAMQFRLKNLGVLSISA